MLGRLIVIPLTAVSIFLVSPNNVSADLVTFGFESVDRLVDLGPQFEGDFTYTATVGEGWELQEMFSVDGAALVTFFNEEGSSVGDTVELAEVNGSLFTFDSLQFSTISPSDSDDVNIIGLRDGNVVDSVLLDFSSTNFIEVDGFVAPIDRLQIVVTSVGFNAAILDNIELNVVPEPTVSVFMLAVWMATSVNRRKRRVS